MKMKYFIQDWAGHYIAKKDGVPTEFESWEDAEEFLSELLGDNYEIDRGEYYIFKEEE